MYYSELTFYTMSLVVLLLAFSNISFDISNVSVKPGHDRTINKLLYLTAIFILGLILPIVHVLIKRKKSELDRFLIQTFSIIVNTISCLYSFGYIYNTTNDWLYIFPLWNFTYALILPLMIKYDLINVDPAFEREASLKEVFTASVILVSTFYFCQYKFNLYWGITFSICVFLSTSITGLIARNEVKIAEDNNTI